MARARNIKPSFFTNDELSELEPLARLLFIGMWTIADYKGCFEYKPKRVKVQLLPYDDCDVDQLAINLDKSGFISIYSVHDQLYVKVLNFDKHQNPHKNERDKGSDIPDISEAEFLYCEKLINNSSLQNIENNLDKNGTNHDKNESDRADSFNLIPDSLNPDVLIPVCQNQEQHTHNQNQWHPNMHNLENILKMTKHSQRVNEILGMEDFNFHLGNFNAHHEKNIQLSDNQRTRKFSQWLIQEFEKQDRQKQNPVYQTAAQRTALEHEKWRMAEQQTFGEKDVTPVNQFFIGE